MSFASSLQQKEENVAKVSNSLPTPKAEVVRSEKAVAGPDPRPDLTEDTDLWTALITEARKCGAAFGATLAGFRSLGARLAPNRAGNGWMIRPTLCTNPDDIGWRTQADYEEDRDRWLKPKLELLKGCISRLRPPSSPQS